MAAYETVKLTSAAPGPKTISGGVYIATCQGTGFGTVAVQIGLPDGTTYATVNDPLGNAVSFSAAGVKTVLLPPGQVQISIVTATAVTLMLTKVPD